MRAEDRAHIIPTYDVVRGLKAGIDPPVPLSTVRRQFEIERLPPRVEYPVKEQLVLHNLRAQSNAVR